MTIDLDQIGIEIGEYFSGQTVSVVGAGEEHSTDALCGALSAHVDIANAPKSLSFGFARSNEIGFTQGQRTADVQPMVGMKAKPFSAFA